MTGLHRGRTLALVMALLLTPTAASAQDLVLSVGARIMMSSWTGSNDGGSDDDFDASGSQLGFNASLQRGRFYAGLSLQGGDYDFENGSPDRVDATTSTRVPDATISRGEFDLSVGYFFWDQVSLFLDLKGSSSDWADDDVRVSYGGLGFGVSGFHPLDANWIVYGTLGTVPLDIERDRNSIGDGRGSALELGLRYRLSAQGSLSVSLKSQQQRYEFDTGNEQRHRIGGLMFGYQHGFAL